ncbi:polysaccharide biosynthesis tyrosine autokinase [Streptomyces sp. NPDC093982]|uniref:polysaccharide biosynthesis tyrosine autokinase n=1 Tax=Streptomyces sp. NPDC093982 TaxID=3155077 RepID=UPI00343AD940
MDLHGFLKVLARRWLTVVACLVTAIGTAVVTTTLSAPLYEARTQLFVATRASDDTTQLNQGQNFSQARVQSYAAIVATRQVTEPVVKELRLDTTPEELASRIRAVAPLNTVLINITVQDSEPRRAALIANAVAVQFSAIVERLETPKPAASPRRPGKTPSTATSPVSLGITQEAVPPTGPVSPRPLMNLALGTLSGLVLGAGLVALRETLDTTFKMSESLNEFTALPGLGAIPYDRKVPKWPLASADGHSTRAEAFRKLRTNLQFSQVNDRPRTIVVTSSVPGEGKTNTAVNLALALAEAGVSTCLVDADLRHPCVAGVFGLIRDAGLTTMLIGQATFKEVVQPVGPLDVLTSGPVPPNPTELLSSTRMEEVLREMADTYEVVVVDTAPLLPVADTLGLASLTHGALLVVRAASTRRDQVRMATESLDRVGVRVLGTVFNMAPSLRGERYGPYSQPTPPNAPLLEEAGLRTALHTPSET